MRAIPFFALFLSAALAGAATGNYPHIDFVAESAEFADATEAYQAIWREEGEKISAALESATGLQMESGPIRAIVYEGISNSGYKNNPMRMRASYPPDTKRATLVHELAHRLIADLVPQDYEEHPIIFLFVYDVWVELWGREFADAQVEVEGQRRGNYDYESAWRDALALGAEGRAERWSKFLEERRRR
jgi:hypothetical protein